MQQSLSANLQTFSVSGRRHTIIIVVASAIIAPIMIFGCAEDSNYKTSTAKPFAGISLNLRIPDPVFREILTPAARSWAERTGASLNIVNEPMRPKDDSDLGVIEVSELGAWAERGELIAVPAELRSAEHPFQWNNLLPAYQEQLIEWDGQAQAIPLAGDGFVIVYRADRLKDPKFIAEFDAQFHLPPAAPTTWEDFAALAKVFADLDRKSSIPPLANAEIASLFFRIAACHDRLSQTEIIKAQVRMDALERLSFQFNLATGEPRLITPAFEATAAWFEKLVASKCLPAPVPGIASDPGAAFAKNQAMIGVMSLAQLARLPRENGAIPERYGLAPLPGTLTAFDREKQRVIKLSGPNYVPYFAGGRVGVVRTRCSNPAAAFDLLAELGGPTRSLETIASTELGAGPFRSSQLDRDRLPIWYGYGFDAARTEQLRNALLQYVKLESKNSTYGLRGPDQAALTSAAESVMGKIASGMPGAAGLKELQTDWKQLEAKYPPATLLRWRKLGAGLN